MIIGTAARSRTRLSLTSLAP